MDEWELAPGARRGMSWLAPRSFCVHPDASAGWGQAATRPAVLCGGA